MKKISLALGAGAIAISSFAGIAFGAITPPPGSFPTDVEQCKDGGWQNYGDTFKNQGDCVSFIETGGKNAPDGPAKN